MSEWMSPKRRFMGALLGGRVDRPSVASATSTACIELMDKVAVYFPDAHLDPKKMAALGAATFTELGFDAIAPVFSVQHEAAALGCPIDWGRKDMMPDVKAHLYKVTDDPEIPPDFLEHDACQVVLDAIRILKKDFGREAAIVGKVFGPWTLSYHLFGTEEFLMLTIDDPEQTETILHSLKEVTVAFAKAQIDAGADALTLADHATGDLCSPMAYRDVLAPIHAEFVERIECPLILHICGDTADRLRYIAATRIDCFHFDSKVPAATARDLVGDDMSLMGNVNNPVTLYKGTPDDVRREVEELCRLGIDIIGPECAIPLTTPIANLKAIVDAVAAFDRME